MPVRLLFIQVGILQTENLSQPHAATIQIRFLGHKNNQYCKKVTCVAVSDSLVGPFIQQNKQPIISSEKCIDRLLFVDDDGNNVWVAEMNDDWITIKAETIHPCIHVSQAWGKVWPRVNEWPFVIKHHGKYYMTYSANSYESPFYGIGCASQR